MPPDYPADDSDDASFDPFRHREEIELMEQRFRERAERSEEATRATTTGAIDARVQDEMRQFFSESAQRLEEVVPKLQAQNIRDTSETTGEIRRKIEGLATASPVGAIPHMPAARRTGRRPRPARRKARPGSCGSVRRA